MDELDLGVDNEYDLSEIEARLYSQVFHGNPDEETHTNIESTCDISLPVTNRKQSFRYFGNKTQPDNRQAVKIRIDSANQIPVNPSVCQSNLTILTPSNTNSIEQSNNGYQNITVNQYTIPVIIHTDNLKNSRNVEYATTQNFNNFVDIENFTSCDDGRKLLTRKERNKLRNKRKRYRQKLKRLSKDSEIPNNKIIFISDESGDECFEMKEYLEKEKINISVESKKDMEESDEDDIIYIPPPPIEVINIDEDVQTISKCQNNQENSEQEKSVSINNPLIKDSSESMSNDFLEHSNTENTSTDFNFSLHGSDFNNLEFARPSTPVDFCETESSCSTNDQNKDFNNSAKTIVFDEVEFPREDIFADKDLDGFSSFITPKRATKTTEETSKEHFQEENVGPDNYDSDSSKSSIESDYESAETANNKDNNLPTLSLMLSTQILKNHSPMMINMATDMSEESQTPNSQKRKSEKINNPEENSNKFIKKKKKPVRRSEEFLAELNNTNDQNMESDQSVGEAKIITAGKKKKRKKNLNIGNKSLEGTDLDSTACNDTPEEGVIKKKQKKKKCKKSNKTATPKNKTFEESGILDETTAEDPNLTAEDIQDAATTSNPIEDCEHSQSTQKHIDEEPKQACLDEILDPNDINLFNDSIHTLPDVVKEDDDDVIFVEDKVANPVVVVDDISDTEVELIETISLDADSLDYTSLQLANFNTTIPSTSVESCNQTSINGIISMDFINSFDVNVVQSKQSDNPQKWLISEKDSSTYIVTGKKGPRCSRCRHFGHVGIRCPDKPHPPQCILCGSPDHQEPRCPNKLCRQCGNPGDYSTTYCYQCFKYRHMKCNLCEVPGHIAKHCPDLWRRYHLTTDDGPIVTPTETVMRPRNQQWCSGCARQGHLEHECNDINYHRQFPPTRPDIVTYGDALNDRTNQTEENPTPETVPQPLLQNNLPLYTLPNLLNNFIPLNLVNPISQFTRTVIPNSFNSNLMIHFPNLLPNPCVLPNFQQNFLTPNLIEQMKSNFQNANATSSSPVQDVHQNSQNTRARIPGPSPGNCPSKFDMAKIEELFMSKPYKAVLSYVNMQMDELDTQIVNFKPKLLRSKLFKYDKMPDNINEKVKKERKMWFRILNMYIFGIHALNDGRIHCKYLRNFLATRKDRDFNETRRRSLFHSYSFIFGVDKHPNINYHGLIKVIANRFPDGTPTKPL